MENEQNTLTTIPFELRNMITFYLSWSNLIHMSLACKEWKEQIIDPTIMSRIGEGSSYEFLKQYGEKFYELNQKARKSQKENFTPRSLNKRMRSLVKNKNIAPYLKKIALLNLFVQGCFLNGIDKDNKLAIEYVLDNKEYDFAYFMLGLGSRIPQKDVYFSTDMLKTIKALCDTPQDSDTTSISEKLAALDDIIVPNFRINSSTSFFDHCCDLSNLPHIATPDFYETASTLFKLGASRIFSSPNNQTEIEKIYNESMKIDAIEHADTIMYVLYQLGVDLKRVLLKTCQFHGDKQTILILLQYINFEQGELIKLTDEHEYLRTIINEVYKTLDNPLIEHLNDALNNLSIDDLSKKES
jgi:hypothetical protein